MADFGESKDRRLELILFAVAVVLYIPAIWWGLPHATGAERAFAWGSDELAPVGSVAELYRVFLDPNPVFNPQYPLLHYAVQAILVAPYLMWLMLTGGLSQPSSVYPYGLSDPTSMLAVATLLSRITSLLMGAGVVVAAWKTGAIMWGRRAGIIAALLTMVSYPMFYYSRTSNVDMPALFWTSVGLAVFAVCLRDGLTSRRAIWLGVLAALATASKDASFFVFLAMTPALVPWRLFVDRPPGRDWLDAWKPIVQGAAVSLALYLVASGIVFSPARFGSHLQWILHSTQFLIYPDTLAGDVLLLREATGHVVASLGLLAAIFGIIGLVVAIRRDRKALYFALAALAVLAGSIMPVNFVNFRYVMPIVYLGGLMAALGFETFLGTTTKPWLQTTARVALVVAVTAGLLRGFDLTHQMLNDSRYAVGEWLADNMEPGDRLGYFGATQKLPALAPEITTVHAGNLCTPTDWQSEAAPEFVVIMPMQDYEPVHAWGLAESVYQGLHDGSLGYQQVLYHQTRSLFAPRRIPFVNPPVQIFVRNDRLEALREPSPLLTTSDPVLGPVETALGVAYRDPQGMVRNYDRAPDPCTDHDGDGIPSTVTFPWPPTSDQ